MLIEFKGENTNTVMMFGTVATTLLKMMGQSGNAEGAIRAPELPTALQKLNDALASAPQPDKHQEDEDGNTEISIQTRAKPLIDLMEESIAEGSYLMWTSQ